MNKKEAFKLAYKILTDERNRTRYAVATTLGIEDKVLTTYKDACDAVFRVYMDTEPEEEEIVWTGLSRKGTTHAIRPSGVLYCESEVVVSDEKEGRWLGVDCKTCHTRRKVKSRLGDV